MAEIFDFSEFMDDPDLGELDPEGLSQYLQSVRGILGDLNAREPDDMEGEAHESWGEQHEVLEDLIDDILDILDSYDGSAGSPGSDGPND